MKTAILLLFASLAAHGQTITKVELPKPPANRVQKPQVRPVNLGVQIPSPPVAVVRVVTLPKNKVVAVEAKK